MKANTRESYETILRELQTFLWLEYASPDVSLNNFANHIHRSRRSIQRALKFMDTTWRNEILKVRMVQATSLLINSNLPVEEVGTRVGYSSSSGYFSSAFEKYSGVYPSKYREIHGRAT